MTSSALYFQKVMFVRRKCVLCLGYQVSVFFMNLPELYFLVIEIECIIHQGCLVSEYQPGFLRGTQRPHLDLCRVIPPFHLSGNQKRADILCQGITHPHLFHIPVPVHFRDQPARSPVIGIYDRIIPLARVALNRIIMIFSHGRMGMVVGK